MSQNKSKELKHRSPPATARHKWAGKIPGVSVGSEVNTSIGKKKKANMRLIIYDL